MNLKYFDYRTTPASEKEQATDSVTHRIGQCLLRIGVILFTFSVVIVLLFRWINPPTTSFMLQRQYASPDLELQHEWTDWENIASHTKMAAITSEDQDFARHWGVDFESIQKAINEYEQGQDLRGASTITQQVAKNLFLWGGQSFLRKGIEAYFTLLIELLWSKERILAVYLNIVEFGNGIYGIHEAAEQFFQTQPAMLTRSQSALMMTALPAPKRYNLDNPSQYMLNRRDWILYYMNYLGNDRYLDKL